MLLNDVIKEKFEKINLNAVCGKGGLPLMYDGEDTYVSGDYYHSIVIGETGSKKSRLLAMPMVVNLLQAGENCVITDPKGEIYKKTHKLAEKNNYNIVKLDFSDLKNSSKWDIFREIKANFEKNNLPKALELINDFAKRIIVNSMKETRDKYWEIAPTEDLTSLLKIFFLTERETYTFKSFMDFYREFSNEILKLHKHITIEPLDKKLSFEEKRETLENTLKEKKEKILELKDETSFFFEKRKLERKIREIEEEIPLILYPKKDEYEEYIKNEQVFINRYSQITDNSRTDPCIMQIIAAAIQELGANNLELLEILQDGDFKYDDLYDKKTVVYLIIPDQASIFDSLVNIFVDDSYSRLSDLILEKKETSLKIRLNYILDEFANIPCIENFDKYISVGRSKNIRFTLFLQNIGQLKKYGDKKEIILGNASNIVYLYSKEKETVNFIYEQVKDYINLKGLKKLDKDLGEAIMLLDRHDPYLAHLKDIDDVLASLNLEEVA